MSKSPSPRSTNNPTPSPTPSPAIADPTSRTQTHDQATSSSAVEHFLPSSSSLTFVHPPPSPPRAGPSRRRPIDDETPSEQPMTKRLRAEPTRSRPSDRSSPSSDSQSGMADTEDGERGQISERSPASAVPTKKKRTRTLTTPHQSAVLHALLAQSRFPTTAMREEVGRAIGLSARKVQIWFQNQRQKARRPRTSNEMILTRPPQYGPFPFGEEGGSVNLYPRPHQGSDSYQEHYDQRTHQTYMSHAGESTSPSGLLGPGVPGGASRRPSGSSPELSPVSGPSTSHAMRTRDFVRRPPSPRMYAAEHPRPSSSHSATSIPFRDASRTLPPLVFPLPSRHGGSAGIPSVRSAPAHVPPPFPFQQNRSPELAFRSPSTSTSTEPRSGSSALPPPFTLEPQPQWNDPVFTSVPLTASSTWSHHGSDRGGSSSPTVARTTNHPRELSEPVQALSSREGRYDPVRSVVVPYRSPKSPSSEHENE